MKPRLALLVVAGLVVAPTWLHAQGRVVVDTVRARTLVGNRVGDAPVREIYTYLPPSYDRERTRRFPVLYLLHGLTSHPREWLDGSYQGFDLRRAMDSLARGGAEYLVVMPHADNGYGGTFYVNSAAFGRWEDFIGRELVAFVDGRFRTMRDRRHRGIAGQSMGGFGALSVVQSHAATFAYAYAMSPCCLTFAGDLSATSTLWRAAARLTPANPPRTTGERIVRAMATAFAPTFERSAALQLPFAPRGATNQGVPGIVRTWERFLPVERLTRDPAAMKAMCAVLLDYGTSDQVASVSGGVRAYAAALQRAGVPHTVDAYDGGHVDRARERFERHVLPYFARAFSTAVARPGCSVSGG